MLVLLGYPKLKILFELLLFLLPKINQTQIPKQNPVRGCLKVSLKSPYEVDCCVKDTWPGACHGFGEAQAPSRAESAGAALRESNKTILKPQCLPPKLMASLWGAVSTGIWDQDERGGERGNAAAEPWWDMASSRERSGACTETRSGEFRAPDPQL